MERGKREFKSCRGQTDTHMKLIHDAGRQLVFVTSSLEHSTAVVPCKRNKAPILPHFLCVAHKLYQLHSPSLTRSQLTSQINLILITHPLSIYLRGYGTIDINSSFKKVSNCALVIVPGGPRHVLMQRENPSCAKIRWNTLFVHVSKSRSVSHQPPSLCSFHK